jgi:RNA polymerase sigma factor (sigma-70 family)
MKPKPPTALHWINPVSSHGDQIAQELLDAAAELWPEATVATGTLVHDRTRTSEFLEMAVHSTWSRMRESTVSPENTKAYLRQAFYRLLHRAAWREGWMVYSDSDTLGIGLKEGKGAESAALTGITYYQDRDAERVQRRTAKAQRYWGARNKSGYDSLRAIETSADLQRLLSMSKLNEKEKTLLKLRWIEEDDFESISARTRIPVGSVRVMVHRALAKLKRVAQRGSGKGAKE